MVTTILKRDFYSPMQCCKKGNVYIDYYESLKSAAIDIEDGIEGINFCPFCGAKIEYID